MSAPGTLDNQIITIFILSCVSLVVLALGFAIRSWIVGLSTTLKELNKSIHELTTAVGDLRQEQAVQRLIIRQQAKELAQLKSTACTIPDCPNKHVHFRSDDTPYELGVVED